MESNKEFSGLQITSLTAVNLMYVCINVVAGLGSVIDGARRELVSEEIYWGTLR